MKKLTIFIGLAFVLVLCAAPVYANDIPALPHSFYGSVDINGSPAPVGTRVEARGEGVLTNIADNPTITSTTGIYGTSNPFEHRLVVQGDIAEGETLTFYVNGVSTGQTAPWHSEGITELHLSVTIAVGVGGGGAPPAVVTISGVGSIDLSPYLDAEGKTTVEIVLSSTDGLFTIIIPFGTQVLDAEGNVLENIEVIILSTPPPPPGYVLVSPAYDCLPDGATFEPEITTILTYDPADIPDEVSEEDLVINYYDEEAGEWVKCECICDPETNCVTACVCHFTPFALLAYTGLAAFVASDLSITPAEVDIGGEVTISVLVTNTGDLAGSYEVTLKIDNIVVASQEVTLDAGASEAVTFTTSKDVAGSYSVDVNGLGGSFTVKEEVAPPAPPPPPPPPPEVKPPFNWPLVGGIIGAVIVVGLLIFFLVVRRRAY